MESTIRPQNETWKVFGSDEVLEDKDLIEYYKLHQLDEKLIFKLLGDFTSEGKYVLPDDTKKLLVGVKKLIAHSGENSYLAEAEMKTRTLRFAVKFWQTKDKAIANLYFIENLNGEDMQTFVAQYTSEKDESFLVKVKTIFNLVSEAGELEDKFLDEIEQLYGILEAKRSERDFVVEIQSEFFLYEFLKTLREQCGEKGKQIADQIELEIEEKKLLTNKDGMYTAARLKMDRLIIAAGGFNALKEKLSTLPKVVQVYTKPVKDYDDISRKLDAMKPPSDQASSKSGGGAKKGGSKKGGAKKGGKKGAKKGGDGGKKKADKKDAKKDKPKDLMLGSDVVKNWWANRQAVGAQPSGQQETAKGNNAIGTQKPSASNAQAPAADGILKQAIVARAPERIVSCLDAFGLTPVNPLPVSAGDFVGSGQIIEENLSYIEIATQETVVDVVEMRASGIGSDDLVAMT